MCSISMLLTPLFLTIFTSAFRILTHLQLKVMLMNEYDTNGYSQSPILDAKPDAIPWLRPSCGSRLTSQLRSDSWTSFSSGSLR